MRPSFSPPPMLSNRRSNPRLSALATILKLGSRGTLFLKRSSFSVLRSRSHGFLPKCSELARFHLDSQKMSRATQFRDQGPHRIWVPVRHHLRRRRLFVERNRRLRVLIVLGLSQFLLIAAQPTMSPSPPHLPPMSRLRSVRSAAAAFAPLLPARGNLAIPLQFARGTWAMEIRGDLGAVGQTDARINTATGP